MKRTQCSIGFALIITGVAATAAAGVSTPTQVAVVTGHPSGIEADPLSGKCRAFLEVPADAKIDGPLWASRLSIAACRLGFIVVTPVSDREKLAGMVAALDRAIAPSASAYRDMMANGPMQIQILAAYGLAEAYAGLVARARGAIPTGGDIMKNPALAERYLSLHQSLEPLLKSERESALAAYAEAVRLADSDPALASADQVATKVVALSRVALNELR